MKVKRRKKRGTVYLLIGKESNGDVLLKYGCTSNKDIKPRIYYANKTANKVYGGSWKFKFHSSFVSKDMFTDENKIKWKILSNHFAIPTEFIPIDVIDLVLGVFNERLD